MTSNLCLEMIGNKIIQFFPFPPITRKALQKKYPHRGIEQQLLMAMFAGGKEMNRKKLQLLLKMKGFF